MNHQGLLQRKKLGDVGFRSTDTIDHYSITDLKLCYFQLLMPRLATFGPALLTKSAFEVALASFCQSSSLHVLSFLFIMV